MSKTTKDKRSQALNGLANRIVDLERRADRHFALIEKLSQYLAKLNEIHKGK